MTEFLFKILSKMLTNTIQQNHFHVLALTKLISELKVNYIARVQQVTKYL